ncbi:MAG: glycoside hydrolase family 5 protein [Muribaculum sp.]
MKLLTLSILTAFALFIQSCGAAGANTTDEKPVSPVEKHGQLKVDGAKIVDCHGEPVQLRGVSFGWHNMWPRFYNRSSVAEIANDWGADIVRASIGLDLDDETFDKKPEKGYALVDSIVQGAVENGVYVLIDFHSHANNLPLAKEFFANVSKKYGHLPNVLYEIWNEPLEVEWAETKSYAEELLPVIRENAPEAIVIVPTPRWDQNVHEAADDPITTDDNIVYSLHYYAATHTDYLREQARYAIGKGLPLFMAECASMVHTGDGVIDTASWEAWMDLADEHGISWICWSVSDKDETCSMLRPSASSRGEEWTDADLKPWAVLVKYYLKRNR